MSAQQRITGSIKVILVEEGYTSLTQSSSVWPQWVKSETASRVFANWTTEKHPVINETVFAIQSKPVIVMVACGDMFSPCIQFGVHAPWWSVNYPV